MHIVDPETYFSAKPMFRCSHQGHISLPPPSVSEITQPLSTSHNTWVAVIALYWHL